jgi:2',3'-cyclic-nucleotide 2'-phosphodiesterase (5'-nucleotidase family)
MTDAMFSYRRNMSATADCAIINAGGIRSTIDIGPITRGEVLTAFPFGNAIVEISMTGDELWKSLEGAFTKVNQYNGKIVTSSIQVSKGIKITWNPNNANGTKITSIQIGATTLAPIDRTKKYNIVTLDFLAGGGDNIFQVKTDFAVLDTQDEVLTRYIISQSPVNIALDGRITASNSSTASGTTTGGATPTGATPTGTSSSPASAAGLSKGQAAGSLLLGAVLVAVFGAAL